MLSGGGGLMREGDEDQWGGVSGEGGLHGKGL